MRSLALKGRRFEAWQEIVQAGEQATAYWNAHRHPYVWGRRRRHHPRRSPGIALAANARTLTRARVLLKSDEGWTDAEIAEMLDITEQTIRNIRQRFRAGGIEVVLTDKRQERRRQALNDEQAAHLIAVACSNVPVGHDHWTMRMLAGKAVELGYVRNLSPETVRQFLKKTR